jgi:Transketolase, pyrimidine binding domain
LPAGWDHNLPVFPANSSGIAGRDASGKVLNVLAQSIPWFLGGSADLGPSNKTTLTYEGAGSFEVGTPGGKNLHFGIREHAMAATINGLSLSKLRAFGATFFIFSDYARPAIRLSALMELPTIFVFTHDAMGDGEDGLDVVATDSAPNAEEKLPGYVESGWKDRVEPSHRSIIPITSAPPSAIASSMKAAGRSLLNAAANRARKACPASVPITAPARPAIIPPTIVPPAVPTAAPETAPVTMRPPNPRGAVRLGVDGS